MSVLALHYHHGYSRGNFLVSGFYMPQIDAFLLSIGILGPFSIQRRVCHAFSSAIVYLYQFVKMEVAISLKFAACVECDIRLRGEKIKIERGLSIA